MSDYIDRCPTCFGVLLDTEERLNSVASILLELGAITAGTVTKAKVLTGIRLLGSYAWTDDPILTPKGLSGVDYTGITRLKATQFKELQIELSRLEKEFVNWNYRTYFSFIKEIAADGYFIPKKAHLQQIRFSIYKLLYVTGTSWEDYFTKDEHDVIHSETSKSEFTDFAENDMSLMKHIKAIHIEDVRHGAIRWWRDRFRYVTDLHDSWGWHVDSDSLRGSGNTGPNPPEITFIDEDVEDVRHQEIGLHGLLQGRSTYAGKFYGFGKLYRDNKNWSESLEDETEGKSEIYLESSASADYTNSGAHAESVSTFSMDWKPWKFRILKEDKKPRVKLRDETNFYIKGTKNVSLYSSLSKRPLSQGYALAAIYIDLAVYDEDGNVYPIRYELQSNFNEPTYSSSSPTIKANLDTFFLDNEHLIISGETLINHLNYYYGTNKTYYFCHSMRISTKTRAFAFPDSVGKKSHTCYAKFSYFIKEVGLTNTIGLVRNIINSIIPWYSNIVPSPVLLPSKSSSSLPYIDYVSSSSPGLAGLPVPENERERAPEPSGIPSSDDEGKIVVVPQPGEGPNPPTDLPWENPPPIPPPTEEERYAYIPKVFIPIGTVLLDINTNYLRNIIVNSYITLQTIANYVDFWYENITTGIYEVIAGTNVVGDPSFPVSETDSNYPDIRQKHGNLIEQEENVPTYEILGYQLTEDEEIYVTIGGLLAGATYPLMPLCNNWTCVAWFPGTTSCSAYYGTVTVPMSLLLKENQKLYELAEELVPEGLDFDFLRNAYGDFSGMSDDALGIFINRGLNYEIIHPNGQIQHINYKNTDLDSGGVAETGTNLTKTADNVNYTTETTVSDHNETVNIHLGSIPESVYNTAENIGADITGDPWATLPDVGGLF